MTYRQKQSRNQQLQKQTQTLFKQTQKQKQKQKLNQKQQQKQTQIQIKKYKSKINSSSLPHNNRHSLTTQKTYNYLQSPSRSPQQFSKNATSSLPFHPYNPSRFITMQQQSQHQLLVSFQLRRQKQKVIILQERLKNKQSFIKQMKQFQDELTQTFEKCQQDLIWYKKQVEMYQSLLKQKDSEISLMKQRYEDEKINFGTFNHLVNLNSLNSQLSQGNLNNQNNREYLQEIAQLKHLVIRLQEEINYYEKKQRKYNKNLYNSAQKQFYPKQIQNLKTEKTQKISNNYFPAKNKPNQNNKQNVPQRSKTLANEFNQKEDQNYKTINKIHSELTKEKHKVASFINHFLTMVDFFHENIEKEQTLKGKLKKAWKWIKNVVVEWNYLKTQNISKIKEYKIGNSVMKYLPPNTSSSEAEIIINRLFESIK